MDVLHDTCSFLYSVIRWSICFLRDQIVPNNSLQRHLENHLQKQLQVIYYSLGRDKQYNINYNNNHHWQFNAAVENCFCGISKGINTTFFTKSLLCWRAILFKVSQYQATKINKAWISKQKWQFHQSDFMFGLQLQINPSVYFKQSKFPFVCYEV